MHDAVRVKACWVPNNPRGAAEEGSYDPREANLKIPRNSVEGRIASLRSELLPTLSSSGTVSSAS
jgi:hypothetical protein